MSDEANNEFIVDQESMEMMENCARDGMAELDKLEWEEFAKRVEDRWRATHWLSANRYTTEEISFVWALTESFYQGMITVLKEDFYRHEELIKKVKELHEASHVFYKTHECSKVQEEVYEAYLRREIPTKEEKNAFSKRLQEFRSTQDWDDATYDLNEKIAQIAKELSLPLKLTSVFEPCEGGFFAFIKEIPGVHSEGKTIGEATENVRDALKLLIKYQDKNDI